MKFQTDHGVGHVSVVSKVESVYRRIGDDFRRAAKRSAPNTHQPSNERLGLGLWNYLYLDLDLHLDLDTTKPSFYDAWLDATEMSGAASPDDIQCQSVRDSSLHRTDLTSPFDSQSNRESPSKSSGVHFARSE